MLKEIVYKCFITLGIFTAPDFAGAQEQTYKELWVGKFRQNSPMPWDGDVELYLRYTVKKSKEVPFEGIITWPALGKARSRVSGIMSESNIEFTEKECISGDCAKIFSGARYKGEIDKKYSEIKGQSELKISYPLETFFKGNFVLHRVEEPRN